MTGLEIPAVVKVLLGQAFKGAMAMYQQEQARLAAEVMEKRLRQGKPWAIADDKAAAMLWRYVRAAQEGAARLNLELLAEALVNAAMSPSFAPDAFKSNSAHLSSLTREEVLILAVFAKQDEWYDYAPHERPGPLREKLDTWERVVKGVLWRARQSRWQHLRGEEDVQAHTAPLVRTGWIQPIMGGGDTVGVPYCSTTRLSELLQLVDVTDVASHPDKWGME